MRPIRSLQPSNSATLVFVPPMSPAIIIFCRRVSPSVRIRIRRATSHGGRLKHARREPRGALVDLVAREDVQLGAEALPLAAPLVDSTRPTVWPSPAGPRPLPDLSLAHRQPDLELVA